MHNDRPTRSASAQPRSGLRATLVAALVALAAPTSAVAEDSSGVRAPLLPKYQQECGACHLAFPPGLLPTASWQSVMAGLPSHFGTDASLDAATTRELSAWLAAHAGAHKRVREAPPQDRITRADWFVREHREVNTAVWQRPAIRSPANCAACHTTADRGRFSEHAIQIPQ
jgi:Dihaem cytochrome c